MVELNERKKITKMEYKINLGIPWADIMIINLSQDSYEKNVCNGVVFTMCCLLDKAIYAITCYSALTHPSSILASGPLWCLSEPDQ